MGNTIPKVSSPEKVEMNSHRADEMNSHMTKKEEMSSHMTKEMNSHRAEKEEMNSHRAEKKSSHRAGEMNSHRTEELNTHRTEDMHSHRAEKEEMNSHRKEEMNCHMAEKMNRHMAEKMNSQRREEMYSHMAEKINSHMAEQMNRHRAEKNEMNSHMAEEINSHRADGMNSHRAEKEETEEMNSHRAQKEEMNSRRAEKKNSNRAEKMNSHRAGEMNSHRAEKMNSRRAKAKEINSHRAEREEMNSHRKEEMNRHRAEKMNSHKAEKMNSHRTEEMNSHMAEQMDIHRTEKEEMNSHMAEKINSHRADGMNSHMTEKEEMNSHMTEEMNSHRAEKEEMNSHRVKKEEINSHRTENDEMNSNRAEKMNSHMANEMNSHRAEKMNSHRTEKEEMNSHRTEEMNSHRAEGQYSTAKISVWWDIENCHVAEGSDVNSIAKNVHSSLVNIGYCGPISVSAYGDINSIPFPVQQALNSTGIALNHVPPGVKDASDKKILVDMLFWAVDNAAPANYLLISDNRDFSNALHQLRMRKYNILLAKPQMASISLVTAATSVWLWTSLLAGGPPLLKSDISHSVHNSVSSSSNSKLSNISVSESASVCKPMDRSPSKGRESELINKGKQIHTEGSQVFVPKTSVTPTVQEDQRNTKQNKDPQVSSNSYKSQPQFVAKTSVTPTIKKDQRNTKQNKDPQVSTSSYKSQSQFIGQKSDDTNVNNPQNAYLNGTSQQKRLNGLSSQPASLHQSSLPMRPNNVFSQQSYQPSNMLTSDGRCGNQKLPEPYDLLQGLGSVIVIALATLKKEKILPTEVNITDCILYGDLKNNNIDVKKALNIAIEQKMAITLNLGALQIYLGKDDKLWDCVNPSGGNANVCKKKKWKKIQQFLASSTGQSALMASRCRYEAATIMRDMCLKDLALGNVIHVLHLIVEEKKWIIPLGLGWQPLKFTLPDSSPSLGSAPGK